MEAKSITASRSIISMVVLPRDSNHYGTLYGGTMMGLVDQAAYAAAVRHARRTVVTVCVDHLTFLRPVYVGEVVQVQAQVNYVGRTSMEIGVRMEAESPKTGEVEHVGSAYLTMVALDEQGLPCPVAPVLLESAEDQRRHRAAVTRRAQRLARIGRGTEVTDG